MPIHRGPSAIPGVIQTVLSGRVTNHELLEYYGRLIQDVESQPWRELVDGTGITEMAISPLGQADLAAFIAGHVERLRGGKVAMVAGSDVTYQMFRMWELQREGLGYAVRVFRRMDEAVAWLSSSDEPAGEPT
ncbi:MAG TPA: hypothetical protein VNK41_08690 [Vicinamibacterales bacterium]|nr:hypothetical protein [Vicinamibacterales bacterium]